MQGDSPHGGRDRTTTGLGRPLAVSTLVVVLAMVAIGVGSVLSSGGQGSERARRPSQRSPRRRPQPLRVPTPTSLICGMGRLPISHPPFGRSATPTTSGCHLTDRWSLSTMETRSTWRPSTGRHPAVHTGQRRIGAELVARRRRIVSARVASSSGRRRQPGITRVLRDGDEIWFPNFSADGRTILYTTVRRRRMTLRTVAATGGRSSFLMPGAFGAYSPDGTTIAIEVRRTTVSTSRR